MSGKWTPGPWEVALTNPRWVMNSDNIIAEIEDELSGSDAAGQMAANARLVAAAPELANVLEAMVERFGHDIFTMPQEDRDLLTRAVAVLAKAKGEGA